MIVILLQVLFIEAFSMLEDCVQAMGYFKNHFYYFFSKTGFTESMKKKAQDKKVYLLTLEDMYLNPSLH